MFFADEPIHYGTQDRLERQPFTQRLADGILSWDGQENLVIGLQGPWGSGKSSILNLVVEALEATESPQRPLILRFDPWYFSGQRDLLTIFFREFAAAIGKTASQDIAERIGKQLQAYAKVLDVLTVVPPTAPVASIFAKVLKHGGEAAEKWGKRDDSDLVSVRKRLEGELHTLGKKILVVLDDIDRLTNEEICQMFKLVKAVGNFPNTCYLLAFDGQVVRKALDEVQRGYGAEYLEKIVQMPFQIPMASGEDVNKELFRMLNEVLENVPEERFDRRRWQNLFAGGIGKLVSTIRDAKRYSNAVAFGMSVIGDEVNPVDFLGIEALRVFAQGIYDSIAANKTLFAGSTDRHEQQKGLIEGFLSQADEGIREACKEICKQLFPRLEAAFGGASYGSGWEADWRRELRICSPERFNVYFSMGLPSGELQIQELRAILDDAGDPDVFAQHMQKLISDKRIGRFLDRLEDYTRSEIPVEHVQSMLRAFFDIGDGIPEDYGGSFVLDNFTRVSRVIYQLLKRLSSQQERFDVLANAMNQSSGIFVIVDKVAALGHEHGKRTAKTEEELRPENERTVSASQLAELEKVALAKIRSAAESGVLLKPPRILSILYAWKTWAKTNEPREWLAQQLESSQGVRQFIKGCLDESSSWGSNSYYETRHLIIHMEAIREFADVDALAVKVRQMLATESLSETDVLPLNTFLNEYEGKTSDQED